MNLTPVLSCKTTGIAMRTLPILLCLLVAAAKAEPVQSSPSPTAELLAKSSLLGMQLGIRKQRTEGKIPSMSANCVASLAEESLVPVYIAAIGKSWRPEDLQATDTFLLTPLGKKYAHCSLLSVYPAVGQAAPEPMPELTAAEQAELQSFAETAAGRKLIGATTSWNAESREMVRAGVFELLESCGLHR